MIMIQVVRDPYECGIAAWEVNQKLAKPTNTVICESVFPS